MKNIFVSLQNFNYDKNNCLFYNIIDEYDDFKNSESELGSCYLVLKTKLISTFLDQEQIIAPQA